MLTGVLRLKREGCPAYIALCSMSSSQIVLPSKVDSDAHLKILPIIGCDDASALKQSCKEHFVLPSTEASRAFLSPILASSVAAGAIQCASAVLLFGAHPNFQAADQGGATLLHLAASRRDEAMVSDYPF